MGMQHSPGLLGVDKGYPFSALLPSTHDTHEVSEEAITCVGGGPSGIPLGRVIQEYAASFIR